MTTAAKVPITQHVAAWSTLAAVLVALYAAICLPEQQRRQKELRDLIGYRDLACFSARLTDGILKGQTDQREDLKYDLKAVRRGLDGVPLGQTDPPQSCFNISLRLTVPPSSQMTSPTAKWRCCPTSKLAR